MVQSRQGLKGKPSVTACVGVEVDPAEGPDAANFIDVTKQIPENDGVQERCIVKIGDVPYLVLTTLN